MAFKILFVPPKEVSFPEDPLPPKFFNDESSGNRSSHWRCSVKKVFLEISQNSQENTCARVSFLINLRPVTLFKKLLWHRCFPVKFAEFLRTPFLQNTSGRLLVKEEKIGRGSFVSTVKARFKGDTVTMKEIIGKKCDETGKSFWKRQKKLESLNLIN